MIAGEGGRQAILKDRWANAFNEMFCHLQSAHFLSADSDTFHSGRKRRSVGEMAQRSVVTLTTSSLLRECRG